MAYSIFRFIYSRWDQKPRPINLLKISEIASSKTEREVEVGCLYLHKLPECYFCKCFWNLFVDKLFKKSFANQLFYDQSIFFSYLTPSLKELWLPFQPSNFLGRPKRLVEQFYFLSLLFNSHYFLISDRLGTSNVILIRCLKTLNLKISIWIWYWARLWESSVTNAIVNISNMTTRCYLTNKSSLERLATPFIWSNIMPFVSYCLIPHKF